MFFNSFCWPASVRCTQSWQIVSCLQPAPQKSFRYQNEIFLSVKSNLFIVSTFSLNESMFTWYLDEFDCKRWVTCDTNTRSTPIKLKSSNSSWSCWNVSSVFSQYRSLTKNTMCGLKSSTTCSLIPFFDCRSWKSRPLHKVVRRI